MVHLYVRFNNAVLLFLVAAGIIPSSFTNVILREKKHLHSFKYKLS